MDQVIVKSRPDHFNLRLDLQFGPKYPSGQAHVQSLFLTPPLEQVIVHVVHVRPVQNPLHSHPQLLSKEPPFWHCEAPGQMEV
jgi:hypothetical protein